jgi:predicted aspartyl protease
MTLRVFIHSPSKRAETIALVDSGATENFLNLGYARHLGLPIRRLEKTWKLYNVDGTENKSVLRLQRA